MCLVFAHELKPDGLIITLAVWGETFQLNMSSFNFYLNKEQSFYKNRDHNWVYCYTEELLQYFLRIWGFPLLISRRSLSWWNNSEEVVFFFFILCFSELFVVFHVGTLTTAQNSRISLSTEYQVITALACNWLEIPWRWFNDHLTIKETSHQILRRGESELRGI